jgi:hypothetical protein
MGYNPTPRARNGLEIPKSAFVCHAQRGQDEPGGMAPKINAGFAFPIAHGIRVHSCLLG